MKHSARNLIAAILSLCVAFAFISCAKAPTAEADAARAAVSAAAANPDVPVYAADTLKRAQSQLSDMEAELKAKAYDKAKASAIDAKASAEKSISDAAAGKEAARSQAASLLAELKTSVADADKLLSQARKLRRAKLDYAALGTELDGIKATVQDAQSDYDNGSYASSADKAADAKTRLADFVARISTAVQNATRKK